MYRIYKNIKEEYLKIPKDNYQIGGMFKKSKHTYILVDGTSSAGKTTICRFFSSIGFKCLVGDDYVHSASTHLNEYMKNIPNDYIKNKIDTKWENIHAELMVDDAVKEERVMMDWVLQKPIISQFDNKGLQKNLFIILVYTSLNDLARNLEARRKDGDPRGVFAFNQFADKYVKTTDDDPDFIDTVNRREFEKILLNSFKYEFNNEDELLNFAKDVFSRMNITDSDDHKIKVRDDIVYNFLLNTKNKSRDDVTTELSRMIN